MSRWIELEPLIDMSISVLCGGGNEEMAVLVEDIIPMPSIDICFCRECKYFESKEDWCYWRDEMITADDFCSYGERNGE